MCHIRGLSRGAVCVLLCVLILLTAACKKDKKLTPEPLSPGLSLISGYAMNEEGVAVRTEHYSISEGVLAYFFYGYGLEVMEQMERNATYDTGKNLHGQMYTETESWYDAIMNEVLKRVCQILVYCEAAYDAGCAELSEEELAGIEESVYELRYNAAALYSMELTAYLQNRYGPKMTEADLVTALRLQELAGRYSVTLNAELEAGISAAEALSYAEAHNLSDEAPSRNIAYLIVSGNSADAVQKNAAAATEALQKATTRETMEGLTAYGTPGAEENLIYENTGVSAIRDWLFESGRRVGDVGTVTSGDVTYLLCYTGDSATTRGEMLARMELFNARHDEWYRGLAGKLSFGYNYDIIDSYDVE